MAETLAFLDANVLLRHLLQDHADHSPRATCFLSRIEDGEIRVRTAEFVIFETVFTLQRQYHQTKERVRELVLPIIDLPGVVLPGKQQLHESPGSSPESHRSFEPFGSADHPDYDWADRRGIAV